MRHWEDTLWGSIAIAAIFALVLSIVPAKAADKGGKAGSILDSIPAAQTNSPWTGCWAGANLGYASQSTEIASVVSFDAKDVTYGVGAGCDMRVTGTTLVLGVMADHDWTKADSILANFNRSWFAGGRAGILLSPTTLAYGLVGYTSLDGSVPAGFDSYRGMTLGGGLETMLASNWSLKAEYRYTDLGTDMTVFEHSQHTVRLGLAYRFGAK